MIPSLWTGFPRLFAASNFQCCVTLALLIDFPDGVARRLHKRWREMLAEAQRRYKENPNSETKAEYLRVLKQFADLVLRGKLPRD